MYDPVSLNGKFFSPLNANYISMTELLGKVVKVNKHCRLKKIDLTNQTINESAFKSNFY